MTVRLFITPYRLCIIAGICLAAVAIYLTAASSNDPKLEIASTTINVGNCAPGCKRDVTIEMYNHSWSPIRVLGLAPC